MMQEQTHYVKARNSDGMDLYLAAYAGNGIRWSFEPGDALGFDSPAEATGAAAAIYGKFGYAAEVFGG